MLKSTFGNWKPPKPQKIPKAPVPPRATNPFEAASNRQKAIEDLRSGVCLRLTYEDLPRVVEVHTVGTSLKDRPSMSVFQVGGQSHENTGKPWRTMCFDECFHVSLSELPSSAPRPDYRKGAKNFRRIDAEL